jgi:hypothetical protein
VLDKFYYVQKKQMTSQSVSEKRKAVDSEEEKYFFATYLTSSYLFPLELRDVTFQRQFLSQAFIMLHYLLALAPEKKAKWDVSKMNPSLKPDFTLQGPVRLRAVVDLNRPRTG